MNIRYLALLRLQRCNDRRADNQSPANNALRPNRLPKQRDRHRRRPQRLHRKQHRGLARGHDLLPIRLQPPRQCRCDQPHPRRDPQNNQRLAGVAHRKRAQTVRDRDILRRYRGNGPQPAERALHEDFAADEQPRRRPTSVLAAESEHVKRVEERAEEAEEVALEGRRDRAARRLVERKNQNAENANGRRPRGFQADFLDAKYRGERRNHHGLELDQERCASRRVELQREELREIRQKHPQPELQPAHRPKRQPLPVHQRLPPCLPGLPRKLRDIHGQEAQRR
mmetsp:Transcript_15148/g.38797  ORF Transcript_15148/g.38797 Transcript_15148/m.38797 type:complete len:283 (-) Transcript_15148:199-1047(-)